MTLLYHFKFHVSYFDESISRDTLLPKMPITEAKNLFTWLIDQK